MAFTLAVALVELTAALYGLYRMGRTIERKLDTIMADQSATEADLKTALAKEDVDIESLTTSLPAYVAAVSALTAKAGANPDFAAEVADIQAHDAQVQAAVSGLSAALNAPAAGAGA